MPRTSSQGLTHRQIACLALVAENLTSKEIAVRLGISRHTVDQRLRSALRQLGVPNRRWAVRLMKSGRPDRDMTSQPTLPNSEGRFANMASMERQSLVARLPEIRLPFATPLHPRNRMGIASRLAWIAVIAVAGAGAILVYLAGLESLARLLHQSVP